MKCKTCESILTGRNRVFCSRYCQENRPHRPVEERFWARVEKTDDCWIWKGTRNKDGYGSFGITSTHSELAHRFAYQIEYGPTTAYVCHHCDNPACVRASHLFAGSQSDNMQDCIDKGRFSRAVGEQVSLSKLQADQVLEIRSRANDGESGAGIARDYGVTKEAVYAIVKRKTWKHI